jgi:hypothetical protein
MVNVEQEDDENVINSPFTIEHSTFTIPVTP